MRDRRAFLKSSLTAAALGATGLPLSGILRGARAADGPLVVGAPLPISGAFAANGKYASLGAAFAAQEAGKVLGRSVTVADIDTEGKPAPAARKVQEAMAQGTRLFAGGILSSEALVMGKEAAKSEGVFITTAGADEITGSDCNRGTFRWTVPTFGAIAQTVRPLVAQMPQAKRWYTITPQYVFGEGLLSAAKAVFQEKGIEHVGNSYHSLAEKEFSGYLTNAIAAKPDVLLLLNFGSQSSDALRQAVSFGLKKRMTIVLAWASGLEQFEALGADLCEGVYFGAQYWHGIDSPLNKALVAKVRETAKMTPNYSFAGSYQITKLLLDAATKAGSADGPAVIKALEGMRYAGLTGEEEIRAADHQVIKDYYLLKGKAKSAMKDKDDFAEVIQSGKSFLSPEAAGCKMT
ncbi:branched-chain amino acid ABC transporter substrate-binding protein [Methylobacterium sp. Leaf104]|uniref:ABC transporter substrate-binding protein n=1 Tax=Methylobacterium TaxID=407 RepID=UPI0006FEAD8A|nr:MULTISPECIES: ABC transporter substrate-binding protein [Methylobacterium]KQP38305.1 branched-chain amino acid ABC transporter substrate-binding protein [Methylobacterium sp. Leaf104]MCI9880302.1 ABC transporter substrate-binding protein [Methylobacterium goesingense]